MLTRRRQLSTRPTKKFMPPRSNEMLEYCRSINQPKLFRYFWSNWYRPEFGNVGSRWRLRHCVAGRARMLQYQFRARRCAWKVIGESSKRIILQLIPLPTCFHCHLNYFYYISFL
ncbi:hypothetical protein V1507DRAFT_65660 [Lipomyces tetrasporus]